MKKILIIIIVVLFGIGVYKYDVKKEMMKEEIRKPEVIEAIEEAMYNGDPKAFTDEGIIKTYEIDYDTVRENPMGGIGITMYINNDKMLTLDYIINKRNGIYVVGGGSVSPKLSDLLEGR